MPFSALRSTMPGSPFVAIGNPNVCMACRIDFFNSEGSVLMYILTEMSGLMFRHHRTCARASDNDWLPGHRAQLRPVLYLLTASTLSPRRRGDRDDFHAKGLVIVCFFFKDNFQWYTEYICRGWFTILITFSAEARRLALDQEERSCEGLSSCATNSSVFLCGQSWWYCGKPHCSSTTCAANCGYSGTLHEWF